MNIKCRLHRSTQKIISIIITIIDIFCSDYIVLVKFVNLCVNFYLIDEMNERKKLKLKKICTTFLYHKSTQCRENIETDRFV